MGEDTPMLASRQQRPRAALAMAGGCLLAVAALVALVAGGGGATRTLLDGVPLPPGAEVPPAAAPPDAAGEDLQKGKAIAAKFPPTVVKQMDVTADPCDDFYNYACGGFMEYSVIPEDLGGFARSWDGGSAKIYKEMEAVLKKEEGKAGDWFRSCMMLDHINELGASPIKKYVAEVEAIETYDDLWEVVAKFQFWDVPAFFDWWVGADNLQPDLMNLYLGNGGLILPDYTYYTIDSVEMKSHRAAYRDFIVTQLMLAGATDEDAQNDADTTLEIETELAVYQRLEPYRSLKASFKHLSQDELIKTAPNVNFKLLFEKMGIPEVGTGRKNLVVKAPAFFDRLSSFFEKRSAKSLIPYLRWHLTYNLSPLLSQEFLDATLKVDANLMGITAQPERWHKCVAATKNALPSVVDKLFIEHFFSEQDRQTALTMLDHIRKAFKGNLEQVPWMSEEARVAALEKLHNIFFECGHPTTWETEDWEVSATSYFHNSVVSCQERKKQKLARLSQGKDRRRWSMSVMSVNSYYDNAVNGLFITAGMLQKPFFDAEYDMARNFGGVGAIMGHELTHGFDNTGRKYDQQSRLKDWWDTQTIEEFKTRGQCIASLYSGYEMLGLHVKGNATLGENIADFGGIKSAYHGWVDWYGDERCKGISKEEMPMTYDLCQTRKDPPLTQRQLFWVSFGQNWCDKERDPSIKMSIQTDEHSPDKFRVNGPLSQNDDFARDYACPVGSPMNPAHKCKLW